MSVSARVQQDMSRLKANHRSSLASLAEFHRSEMAGLNASHLETMKKMELQHMEELRNARRVNGHDRDLVHGLHQSYSKQIESLVLDLSEARREVKELKLKQPSSASSAPTSVPTDPALEKAASRTLVMNLIFENLDAPLNTAKLEIPHPGRSYDSLLRILSFSVKNHLQTLNSTARFFMRRATEEHAGAMLKIRNWYEAALQERVHFSLPTADAEGKTMQERWENEYWKSEEFVLGVLCAAEEWESNTSTPYPPETVNGEDDIEDHIHDSVLSPLGRRSPVERLVSIESSISEHFDPAAELERINREIGNLQLHQHLQEQAERELRKSESKEAPPSKMTARKATVESVKDEDDVPRPYKSTPPTKNVPTVKPSKPRQQPEETATSPTTSPVWEDERPEPKNRSLNASLEEGLKQFLEKDFEKARQKGKTTGSGDSWLFDDLFSNAADQDKDKDDGSDDGWFLSVLDKRLRAHLRLVSTHSTDAASETADRGVPLRPCPSNSKVGESARRGSGSGRRSEFGWKWLSEGSAASPPLFSAKDRHPTPKPTKQGFTPPARETYMGNVTSDSDGNDQDDSDYYNDQGGDTRAYFSGRPLFDFPNARLSPAPPPAPPAPEGTTRDSPTVPDYAQTDVGTSHNQGESAHGNDDQAEATDDTPMMGKAQSVVSSTPLLGSDTTSHKSARFGNKKRRYSNEEAGLRMPAPPFPPSSGGGPRGGDSPRSSKYSASQYLKSQGYFRSGSNNDAPQAPDGGWDGSQYTANSEYEPEFVQGENMYNYGQDHEAYTWRHHQEQQAEEAEGEEEDVEDDEERGYRQGSESSPISRSSMTTTDRRTEYVPNACNQPLSGGSIVPPFRYGFGGMRPMAMGPLGPRNGMPAFSNPQHIDMIIQQQMRNQMEELIAGNFGPPPRSSTAPAFSGGPVFAPNPPHSVAARSGGGGVPVNSSRYASGQGNNGSAVSGSAVNVNGLARYPFDSWPINPPNMSNMSLHMPHLHHHHHLFNNNIEPRRSFSNDPISPLLCQQGQGHSPSNSNNPGVWQQHHHQQQQQGGTPVSMSQQQHQWFQQQQQQQGIPSPFEVNWDGSSVNVPMRMPGPWAGYAA